MLRVDQAVDRLAEGDAGADEDRRDDEVAGVLLGLERAHQEGGAERNRGERVADVVDQVGEQRDEPLRTKTTICAAAVAPSTSRLKSDDAQPLARAFDRGVDQPVAMAMPVVVGGMRAHAVSAS